MHFIAQFVELPSACLTLRPMLAMELLLLAPIMTADVGVNILLLVVEMIRSGLGSLDEDNDVEVDEISSRQLSNKSPALDMLLSYTLLNREHHGIASQTDLKKAQTSKLLYSGLSIYMLQHVSQISKFELVLNFDN
uniref:Uncharacterized protein n=1 Tax=Glossina palpalis gambiensis TaxID=67801 RepID=A0A1B0C4U3_9MUSC